MLESFVTKKRDKSAALRFLKKALQKFASVHANFHFHFSSGRHIIDRQSYKATRSAALAEWQTLIA